MACLATFSAFCLVLSASLALTASPPKFTLGEPQALRAESEGKNVELVCPVSGNPPPLIQWSVNAIPLHELRASARRLLLDGGRVLRIHDLNHDLDSGLYQCNATNFHGHAATAVYLKVEAFAPYFRTASQRVWKSIRHNNVDLDCSVEAAPAPDIRWVDAADTPIVPVIGKLEIFDNATLRIIDVSNSDEGYYYCNVSNKYGINRAMNKLEVYGATYFAEVPSPKRLIVDAGDSAEFRCRAQSDARLAITYLWTLNGETQNATLDSTGTSILRMDNVRGDSSGRIDCAAVTDVDVKIASAELIVRDIPATPQLLKVECGYGAQQRALIVWRRPRENGAPITHFSIEAANSFHPGEWEVVYTERNLDRNLFKLILPLSPWMNYTFRVSAHNVFGAGDAAQSAESVCTTHEDVPHTNPSEVKAFGTEPGNMVIQWRTMDKRDWNAPDLRYLVRYRQHNAVFNTTLHTKPAINSQNQNAQITIDEGTPSWRTILAGRGKAQNAWREFFIEDPLLNETIIRDLPIFSAFDVQVRAVNSRGYSAVLPATIKGFSGEDIPEIAPKNLRLIGFGNFSMATLAWDPVPIESIRGYFNGYKVKYWLTEQPYFTEHAFADNASLRVEISGLDAMCNYTASVTVLNSRYESEPSNHVQFATPEGAPSKVHDLRVYAVGSRSIFVTWQPPLRLNGNLRGYFLEFENSTSGAVEETYVLHRQQYYLHESLAPDSPYRVAVWAETNGGEGPRVIRPIRTWPMRNPDPPVFIIRASSPYSVNVEWLPSGGNSTRWLFSGTNFHVKYRSSPEDRWLKSELIILPFNTLEIANLTENTDYEFVGVAQEGTELTKESEPVLFKTDSRHTLSIVNAERLRSAAWFLAVLIALAFVLFILALMCCVAQRRYGFGSGVYEIHIRDKHFRRYESIGQGGRESIRSGSSGTVATEVAFLDDASEEHRRFVTSSANEILNAQNSAKRRAAKQKEVEQEKCNLLPNYFAPPPPQPQQTLLPPKFRSSPFIVASNVTNIKSGNLRVRVPQKPTVKLPQRIEESLPDEIKIEEEITETVRPKDNNDVDQVSHYDSITATFRPIRNTESTNDLMRMISRDKANNKSITQSSVPSLTNSDSLRTDYDNAATLRITDSHLKIARDKS